MPRPSLAIRLAIRSRTRDVGGALNPIIKFSTLFRACSPWKSPLRLKRPKFSTTKRSPAAASDYTPIVGVVMLAIALVFVWRSFYSMRIPGKT